MEGLHHSCRNRPGPWLYAYGYEEDGFEVVDLLNDLEDKKYDERFVDIIEPIAEAASATPAMTSSRRS